MLRAGFTLVEVVVAAVIFTIAVTGVFASLASLKKPVVTNDKALEAAYCGQQFLEGLRAAVDARDWSTGKLAPAVGVTGSPCVINGTTYTVTYTITAVGNARKATVTVSWP